MLNPWLIVGVMIALAIAGASGYSMGARIEKAACDAAKQRAIDENFDIREDQDRVIRPDDSAYIDSLRRGTF